MAVSQVAPVSMAGVAALNLTPAIRINPTVKTAVISAPKPISVELSHAAQARSLKMEGFSVFMIALKLGVGVSDVNQYLGVTEPTSATFPTPTYVQPKPAYTEPKAVTQGREFLVQDLNQLIFAQYTWSNMLKNLLPK